MKTSIVVIALLASFPSLMRAWPGDNDRSTTVHDEVKVILAAQASAWNAGDLAAFMEHYWKSDQLTFSSGGETRRGWQATKHSYETRYPDRAAMGRLTFSDLEVTPLSPDAALVLGIWQLERGDRIGGNFSLVFRRIGERWLIVHDHTSRKPD